MLAHVEPSLVRAILPDDGPDTGVVVKWHVAKGAVVGPGELVAEVETDKTSVEIRATAMGVVLEILHPHGAEVGRHSVLAVLGPPGTDHRAVLDALVDEADAAPLSAAAVGIRCRGECPECGARIAINGPLAEVRCSECGTTNPLSPTLWTSILDGVARGEDFVRILSNPWTIIVRIVREAPACHNCGGPLRPGDAAPGGNTTSIACIGCGLQHPWTAPPEWMRARFPWIFGLLGTLGATSLQGPREPLSCPGCGARQARTHDASPIARCIYCGGDVRPPGAGPPLPRRWYLVR